MNYIQLAIKFIALELLCAVAAIAFIVSGIAAICGICSAIEYAKGAVRGRH